MGAPLSEVPAEPSPPHSSWPQRVRMRVGQLCTVCLILAIGLSATAWLLPFRATGSAGAYDLLFAIAFLSRIYLVPTAIACGLLGVVSFVTRRWWTAGIAIVMAIVMAIAWVAPEWRFSRPHGVDATTPSFSIASFNLNNGLPDARDVFAEAEQVDADFVVCQEVSPTIGHQLEAAFAERYPYRLVFPDPGYDGMAVFARSPLTLVQPFDGEGGRTLRVDASVNGRSFLLVDAHLGSPQSIAKRLHSRQQVQRLIDDLGNGATPAVVIGDFNFTTCSPQGSALAAAGFVDAHRVAGGGRQLTWPTPSVHPWMPRVRIDTAYVVGNAFTPIKSEVGRECGSDHFSIKVTFR